MSVCIENYLIQNPQKIMAQHGKSFYWASYFFNRTMMHQVSSLYTFCRYIDDLADECEPFEAKEKLEILFKNIDNKNFQFSNIFAVDRIRPEYAKELLDGALFDINGERIKTKNDLLVYCYKVAGVVGLMMTKVIGVNDINANSFAIDLGIGMQLTNICRDILEDAQNNRTYIPLEELENNNLTIQILSKKGQTPESLRVLVKQYLDLADQYYESAIAGMCYIPFRARFVIVLAARLYQSIGKKIRSNDYNVLSGRTFLNITEKIIVSFKVIFEFLFIFMKKNTNHQKNLHLALKGLPGVME